MLIVAGEDDELSPIEHTYDFYERIRAPRKLVVYEGAKYNLGGASSVAQGENPSNLISHWLVDRLAGRPAPVAENVMIDMSGKSVPQ